MARLWIRMAALYGEGRWLSHAPRTVMDDWADILGSKTGQDIARALGKLETAPRRFPPGAAEFRELCKPFQSGTFAGNPAPLKGVTELLEGATVESGKARAWIGWCQALAHGERLTREQLRALPSLVMTDGSVIVPANFCVAEDDA